MIDSQLLDLCASRILERCDQLAIHSSEADRLTRTFCSDAMRDAHETLRTWMNTTGLDCSLDATGNLIGRSSVGNCDEIFMIGSHLDTVVNAGRFDGMLGVLLGLGVVEVIQEAGVELPYSIHVVAFSEEEGVRFKFPFIGSQGITGSFDSANLDLTDRDGISMRSALHQFGCNPDEISDASYQAKNLVGFMEAHIEQAVVLEEADVPVGLVTAIAGQTRATIQFYGRAGHAGTVPHDLRQDALAAAAEFILKIEELGKNTTGLFATVGNVVANPGLSNVISGSAELRLDLRHENDEQRDAAYKKIEALISSVSLSRNLSGSVVTVQHSPAVPMDKQLSSHLESAISEAGFPLEKLVSGAGHDAMVMSRLAPSCMLFVRCREGISHHPDEFVSKHDIRAALDVMVRGLIKFAKRKGK